MNEWINGLPRDEMRAAVKQILEGKGQQVERTIRNRFVAWQRGLESDKVQAPRRTVGELRKNAEKAEKISLAQAESDRAQQKIQ